MKPRRKNSLNNVVAEQRKAIVVSVRNSNRAAAMIHVHVVTIVATSVRKPASPLPGIGKKRPPSSKAESSNRKMLIRSRRVHSSDPSRKRSKGRMSRLTKRKRRRVVGAAGVVADVVAVVATSQSKRRINSNSK